MTSITNTAPASAVKEKAKNTITRFNTRQRVEHWVLMILFTLLSISGILQLFYSNSVIASIIVGLGGIENLRLVHRILGLTFTAMMIYHAIFLIYAVTVKRSKPTIMPNIQDFKDVIAELRMVIGLKAKKPQFGRYDYKQKFEYIGLIFGSVILIVSGLFLMFPEAVTTVIPGWFIAAAARFHGYEATLAVLTILIWHLYSVILRPGIFPADTSIHTGKISRERMVEEHPLEYKEMIAKGEIKE